MSKLTFRLPGLPDDDGRVQFFAHEVEYVRGRKLATYLAEDLALEPHQVAHVVINGRVIEPGTMVNVPVHAPRVEWTCIYCGGVRDRKARRCDGCGAVRPDLIVADGKPVPLSVQVPAFDAYTPRRGEEIYVIPSVDGKNASVILGAVGAIAVAVVGFYVGGVPGAMYALKAYGFTAFAIGSAAGSIVAGLTTPKPKMIRDEDGPSSYIWNGTRNDDRAGVAKPILLGQTLVGGKRIGMVRRRNDTVGIRTGPSSYDDSAPMVGSESLELLLLIAGHKCAGPVGLTDPDAPANTSTNKPDVRINGSPYTNFSGLDVEWRTGQAGQSVIRGFDAVRNTYDLAIDLTTSHATTPYVYTTADEIDAFEVLLTLPAGVSHADNEKGIQKNTTRYKLEFRKLGDSTWLNADYDPADGHGATRRLTASTRASRLETRRIDSLADGSPLPRGKYEIRLQWISATHTNTDVDTWLIFLTGINEEIQESRNYEGESLLALRGLATDQLSGPIPTVTSVWRGMPVQKYTTAGGLEAEDFGVGDFAPAGRNVFWQTLALMRNKKIGAGHRIPDDDVDFASFESCAPEADTSEHVVPADGAAEYDEPRHQFDAYLDSDEELVDLVQRMLSTARGVLIFSGKKWRVSVDRPGPITQVFGSGSMQTTGEPPDEEPTFSVQYKSDRHEVNCFEATFNDAAADYETESHAEYIDNRDPEDGGGSFVTTDDPEADLIALGLPILRRKLQFWGVSRRSQVARELRFALKQAYALREFGGFVAGTKSILSEVYDIIGLANDTPQWGYSGRVMDGCLESLVMFDAPVPFEVGTEYQVMVHFRAPGVDGKDLIETRTVADTEAPPDGESYIGVTVTEPFSRVPEEGDEWFYGPVDQVVRPVRIVDIDRDADDNRAISFAEYNASIYVTDGPIRIPQYSLLPDITALPGAIPELRSSYEIILQADGRRVTNILNQWTRPKSTRTEGPYGGARLEYSFDEEHWTLLATAEGIEHRWVDAPHGLQVFFRVIPRSIAGRYNLAGAAYDDVTPEGYAGDAPIVTGINGGYFEGVYFVAWDALGPEFEYEVRSSNPANWKTSTVGFLWRGKTTRFEDDSPDARNLTYYIRARDPFGNYSVAANSVSVNDTAPAAPAIATITRYRDGFKLRVTPPAGVTDIIAIHLHASQSPGFTPGPTNRVANVVAAGGGEFTFKTDAPGNWYFKATCEDWLSERMNDWIYTTEDDDQIIVIQPVDPSSVTTAIVPSEIAVLVPSPAPADDGKFQPQQVRRLEVSWVHSDTANPTGTHIGFRVLVWKSSETYVTPIIDSGLLSDSSQSVYYHRLDEAHGEEITAGVIAVYIEDITSDLITSSGLDIPLDTNPILRNSDDRRVLPYGVSFDEATLPNGFGFDDVTYSLAAPAGELKLTRTGSLYRVTWSFISWAREYREPASIIGGSAVAAIRLKIDTPSQLTGPVQLDGHNGTTTVSPVALPIVNDGEFHTYFIPWGVVDETESGGAAYLRLNLSSSGIPNGGYVHVTGIGIGFDGFDLDKDGNVQRGIKARQQYDIDPDGDGLFGITPIRIGDPNGNYHVVNENGVFFLRDDSGNLVTESAYKMGRQGHIAQYSHGAQISFDTVGAWGLSVAIPEPVSYNKLRIIIQDVASDVLHPTYTAGRVLRRWIEACSYTTIAGTPGFMIAGMLFEGGYLRRYAVTGPWSASAQAKSSLLLQSDSSTTDATSDGWYLVHDDGLPNSAVSPWDWYFRIVVWISITMPTSKRNNGSYHYADLQFTVRTGTGATSGSQMNISSVLVHGPFKIRALADGQARLIPIICGAPGTAYLARDRQDVKVDWHAQTWETGGTGTITCSIDSIDWTYIEGALGRHEINITDISFVAVEEFGG